MDDLVVPAGDSKLARVTALFVLHGDVVFERLPEGDHGEIWARFATGECEGNYYFTKLQPAPGRLAPLTTGSSRYARAVNPN